MEKHLVEAQALLDLIDAVLGFDTELTVRTGRSRRAVPIGRIPEILRLRVLVEACAEEGGLLRNLGDPQANLPNAKRRLRATRKTDVGLASGQSLESMLRAFTDRGVEAAIPTRPDADTDTSRAYRGFANVLVGKVTEAHFIEAYRELLKRTWVFEDLRESNEEVDVRLVADNGLTELRINVKNASAQFAESRAFVGLSPEDCVPLGIYKIFTAVGLRAGEEQIDLERLLRRKPPLLWVYLVDWDLSDRIQRVLREKGDEATRELLDWLFGVKLKYSRDLENLIVDKIIGSIGAELLAEVRGSDYYAISSGKVFKMLCDGQWASRVPKLHVPRAQGRFGGEIGTHLSVTRELTSWERVILPSLLDFPNDTSALQMVSRGEI